MRKLLKSMQLLIVTSMNKPTITTPNLSAKEASAQYDNRRRLNVLSHELQRFKDRLAEGIYTETEKDLILSILEVNIKVSKVHELLFLNPALKDGENVTVRLGTKWAHKLEPGDRFSIRRSSDPQTEICEAHLIGYRPIVFNQITEDMLVNEHDPECTTLLGLAKAMLQAYGEEFNHDKTCTIIKFVPCK